MTVRYGPNTERPRPRPCAVAGPSCSVQHMDININVAAADYSAAYVITTTVDGRLYGTDTVEKTGDRDTDRRTVARAASRALANI